MTLRRMKLGSALARWRCHAGLSRETVAAELGCTPGRVRHLESGRNLPTRPDVIVLCDLYGVPDADRDTLLQTRTDAREPGWWQTYRLPKWLASYVALEAEACYIRNWEGELIPGLLQTQAYAEHLVTIGNPEASAADVQTRTAARLRRQERLSRGEDPLRLDAIMSEAALQRVAAEPDIAEEQFTHLLTTAERSNVSIRILPVNKGIHHAMAGGFVLLDFPEDTWPQTGYQEYNAGGHLVDDSDAVHRLATLFANLQHTALSEQDSNRLIARYAS